MDKASQIIKRHAALWLASLFLLIPAACSNQQDNTPKAKPVNHKARHYEALGRTLTHSMTVGAIGDILIHDLVYEDAKTVDGYDFKPMFAPVKELLRSPDILTANQESLVGGEELGISSYPAFNSPFQLSEAVMDAGVDIVSTANNHSLDKGFRGVEAQIRYFDKIGLPFTGTAISKEGRRKIPVLAKNGIKLSFLSYTYGTNGIPIPEGKEFAVNLIDRGIMKKDIERAREISDAVVVSVHWGNEYQRFPTQEQKNLAVFLAESGADIIFGSHPHVLQPMEWIDRKDGRRTFVVYSLGNFLSAQIRDYKDIGGLATLEITKTVSPSGKKVELGRPSFHPTFVYRNGKKDFRVVPLEKTGQYGVKNPEDLTLEILRHMTQWLR